jgi:Ca2+-binding EF-hand superfamily protein
MAATLLGGLALLTSMASLAQAQDDAGGGPGHFLKRFDKNGDGMIQISELPPRMQQKLGEADANHDGVLTPDELRAHFDALRAQRFARADKNGDGALDASEVGERAWGHLRVADVDGDGRVTRTELDQARASGKIHGGMGGHHKFSPEAFIQRFDTDHDGAVSLSELPEKLRARFAAADTNHDGKLTVDEIAAAQAQRHHRRHSSGADGGTQSGQ